MIVGGRYGTVEGNSLPAKKAIMQLHCGGVDIFKVKNRQPYKEKPTIFVELADWQLTRKGEKLTLKATRTSTQQTCVLVKTANNYLSGFFGGEAKRYFCGSEIEMSRFLAAVNLQKERLKDAARRSREACKTETKCAFEPDGTWFENLDLKKIRTYPPKRVPPS